MPQVEVISRPQQPQTPIIDYEKEYLLDQITEWLCDDNTVVRKLLRQRLIPHSVQNLRDIVAKHGIPLVV